MSIYIIDSFGQKLTLSKNKKTLALSTFLGSSAKYNHKIWLSYDKLIQTKIYQPQRNQRVKNTVKTCVQPNSSPWLRRHRLNISIIIKRSTKEIAEKYALTEVIFIAISKFSQETKPLMQRPMYSQCVLGYQVFQ